MKSAARVIVSLSLLTISCSDTSQNTSGIEAVEQEYERSWMDSDEFCSSIRRVTKDAINGFAALKADERTVPVSKTESMNRVYRDYRENETWFHMPAASDCYISSSLDRPPGTMRWSDYKCRWVHSTLDEAKLAFRDLNRYIEICMETEHIEVRQEKDGQKLSRRIFRAPETSLHLYTTYYTTNSDDEVMGPPALDIIFQASSKSR
jgi:hypothetical protein